MTKEGVNIYYNTEGKKRLLILSDLWGLKNAGWLSNYITPLQQFYEVLLYDSRQLASLNITDESENSIHQNFVNGGIDKAVESLLQTETKTVRILAFSVGGTIAWKYALASGNVDRLVCVSSTRLRHEKLRPAGEVTLCYGQADPFKPTDQWFNAMKLESFLMDGMGHELYKDEGVAGLVANQFIHSSQHHNT